MNILWVLDALTLNYFPETTAKWFQFRGDYHFCFAETNMDGGLKITVILGLCVGVGEYLYYDALADVQSVKCFLFILGSYIQ